MNALYGTQTHVFDDAQLKDKAVAIVAYLKAATDAWKG